MREIKINGVTLVQTPGEMQIDGSLKARQVTNLSKLQFHCLLNADDTYFAGIS